MEIKGKTIGTGKPLLCVPVMESNKEEIIDELRTLAKSEADIVEWRIDTFVDYKNYNAVREVFAAAAECMKEKIFLYTFRTKKQGGMGELAPDELNDLHDLAAESGCVDLLDLEFFEEEHPARKIRIGNKLYFGEDESLVAEVIDNTTSRGRTLRFLYDGNYDEFKDALFSLGETPVPKWVKPHVTKEDEENYQTIFASEEGAVCAPAAGLHFSRELMNRMILKDINKAFITLHMGIGHFRSVDVEDLSKHKMDSERLIITPEAAGIINSTKEAGHKVLAVGITVMRGLETFVTTDDEVKPYDGWTNKFIFPPYRFAVPNAIVSNFHLPESTMLMSVAAFGGYEKVMHAYKVALDEGYKFGPYGDALLIV